MGEANFKGWWENIWGTIEANLGGYQALLETVATLILVGAIIKYFWDKRKGGGGYGGSGQNSTVIWTMAVAAMIALPGVILPLVLGVVDVLVNFGIDLVSGSSGEGGA